MRFCLNSIRKIILRVTSSKRYQNVRSDQTILGPFANVTLTLCVSWVDMFESNAILLDLSCMNAGKSSRVFVVVIC